MRMKFIAACAAVLLAGWSGAHALEGGASVSVGTQGQDLNISFFYDQLGEHGNWYQHDRYGWVWQPAEVQQNRDWKPYFDNGHWVYTDQGWYWHSNYEWGWAPFHYGRWTYDNELSWVWVPDTVWAPAWVAWRKSDNVYGWAPLPPEVQYENNTLVFQGRPVDANVDFGLTAAHFVFVPSQRFLVDNYRTVAIAPDQIQTVYQNTQFVDVGRTYRFQGDRVVNQGITVNEVRQHTNQQVNEVKIAESQAQAGQRPGRSQLSGNQLTAYKPQIKKDAPRQPQRTAQRRGTGDQRGDAGRSDARRTETGAQPGRTTRDPNRPGADQDPSRPGTQSGARQGQDQNRQQQDQARQQQDQNRKQQDQARPGQSNARQDTDPNRPGVQPGTPPNARQDSDPNKPGVQPGKGQDPKANQSQPGRSGDMNKANDSNRTTPGGSDANQNRGQQSPQDRSQLNRQGSERRPEPTSANRGSSSTHGRNPGQATPGGQGSDRRQDAPSGSSGRGNMSGSQGSGSSGSNTDDNRSNRNIRGDRDTRDQSQPSGAANPNSGR